MSIIDPEDPTLALTRALIARPSVTPDDAGCQQLMMDRLTAAGFICEPMRFAEVDNFWATRGTQGPLLVFAGHTDVVPPATSRRGNRTLSTRPRREQTWSVVALPI